MKTNEKVEHENLEKGFKGPLTKLARSIPN